MNAGSKWPVGHHRRHQHQGSHTIRHRQSHLERDAAADRVTDHGRRVDTGIVEHRRHVGGVVDPVIPGVGPGAAAVPAEIGPEHPDPGLSVAASPDPRCAGPGCEPWIRAPAARSLVFVAELHIAAISDFGFRIWISVPNLHPPPGAPGRRGAVAEGLVARAARRGQLAVALRPPDCGVSRAAAEARSGSAMGGEAATPTSGVEGLNQAPRNRSEAEIPRSRRVWASGCVSPTGAREG